MDYEKKYKEAFKRARNYCKGHHTDVNPKAMAEYIFPEFHESEDEKIREEIVDYLKKFIPHCDDDLVVKSKLWIAWLEKQGEPQDKGEIIMGKMVNEEEHKPWNSSPILWDYNNFKHKDEFVSKVEELINIYGIDTALNTPDYLLAEYILNCLILFGNTLISKNNYETKKN